MLVLKKSKTLMRGGHYTASWRAFDPAAFLRILEETHGNFSRACTRCACSHSTVARYRKLNPDFNEACEEIKQRRVSLLEHKVFHKAIYGWPEPVYYKENLVGYKQKHSPELMLAMLRAHRPKTYNLPEVKNSITVEEQYHTIAMYQRNMLSASVAIAPSTIAIPTESTVARAQLCQ